MRCTDGRDFAGNHARAGEMCVALAEGRGHVRVNHEISLSGDDAKAVEVDQSNNAACRRNPLP